MSGFAKRARRRARRVAAAATIPPQPVVNARTYGRVNAYTCQKCGEITWTYDRDEGVTPFMIGCREGIGGCSKGLAHSAFYRVPPDHPPPTHEWYRPDETFARRDERKYPGSMDHWKNGGLWLRPIADAA